MKKIIPFNSVIILYLAILGVFTFVGIVLMDNLFVLIVLSIPILIISLFIYIWHNNKISKDLPGDSFYSPFGFIELHISRKAKKNKHRFYKYCYRTIEIAHREKKDVLFYTWHISKDRLCKIFGEAITITNPSTIDRIGLISCLIIGVLPRKFPHPYIKCYVSIDKLPSNFFNKRKKVYS